MASSSLSGKRSRRRGATSAGLTGPGMAPARRGNLALLVVLSVLVLVNLYVFLWRKGTSVPAVQEAARAAAAMTGPGLTTSAAARTEAPAPAVASAAGGAAPLEVASAGTIDGQIGKGDSLGRVLRRSGLAAADSDELIRALEGVLDFRTIRDGQRFRIERGGDGRVSQFELVLSKVATVRAVRDPAGALVGLADQAATRIEVAEVAGVIDSSLYAAIKAAGESTQLVAFFVDVFAYDLDFYNDTHDGDAFRVLVEKEYKDQEFLRYKRILAAEYAGRAGTFRVFHFAAAGDTKGRYFDDKGASIERSLLKTPLKFARVSSKFDRKRMHPVLHRVKAHLGVDYAAPTGTPVWAAADGKIVSRGPAGGAGNLVVLAHDGGLSTLYMHLSKFAAGQKVGDRVSAKTVIGYVGTTGLSTGPHLHLGVKKNGAFVDPATLAPMRRPGVGKKDLPAFRAQVDQMQARMAAMSTAPKAAVDPSAGEPAAGADVDVEP
ncbi:MAG: M23 family metallopeptidase [Kofleriaceae bacterium]|nr:M23 family metallopeptidase [Kofleriaceae bacterium]MBP6838934.1 M23 family metallopeptidase [Kofleriaceae bacterium]